MTALFSSTLPGSELLTTEEMARADKHTIGSGTPGLDLMETAGQAVAEEVARIAPEAEEVAVLCGPGSNGGDGFVAARHLKGRGYRVRLALLGEVSALKGDAAEMALRWDGETAKLSPEIVGRADVAVDAIFGAGLTRNIEGDVSNVVEALNAKGVKVVAVDVPSGIDGTSGAVRGVAVRAHSTVTFFRRKPGHLLLPGRLYCGAVRVADIGIRPEVLESIAPKTFANTPEIWEFRYRWPRAAGHKYSRGHALVVSGGPEATGAARLGARAALRTGAGLVTLVGSKGATAVNAAHVTAVMVDSFSGPKGLAEILKDTRKNAALIGPGTGVGKPTRGLVLQALRSSAACVLDADAMTSFEKDPAELFSAVSKRTAPVVLTPHDGEFSRLFGELASTGSKLERARTAAVQSRATVILKGPDTVIAHPDGRAAINENAPPWTATAGAGDVLGGIVTGLLAQGMPVFEAACAAVWLHGEAATAFGPGLIAEDLCEVLPRVLKRLCDRGGAVT